MSLKFFSKKQENNLKVTKLAMEPEMPLYLLGTVVEIIESVGASASSSSLPGLSVSHVHEDLVFLEHNAFLLQFTSRQNELLIHINKEAQIEEIENYFAALKKAAVKHKMTFLDGDYYSLTQADDENISIQFIAAEAE